MGQRRAVARAHGLAHLGADQRLVAEYSGSGRRTRSTAYLRGRRARPCASRAGGRRRRARSAAAEGRFGLGPEGDRPGPVLAPLRRRQFDPAARVHGQHDDAGHHFLDPAVGLVPADVAPELLRQGVAVERPGPGDQLAAAAPSPRSSGRGRSRSTRPERSCRCRQCAPARRVHRPGKPRRSAVRRPAAVVGASRQPRFEPAQDVDPVQHQGADHGVPRTPRRPRGSKTAERPIGSRRVRMSGSDPEFHLGLNPFRYVSAYQILY